MYYKDREDVLRELEEMYEHDVISQQEYIKQMIKNGLSKEDAFAHLEDIQRNE